MKVKAKQGQKRNSDREGKKRPFQDDSALILAVMCIMIVAHAYVIAAFRAPAAPQKIVITGQAGDVASAISQNLSAQRKEIEEHIKQFLAVPENAAQTMAGRRPFFSDYSWGTYQAYLAEQQDKLVMAGGGAGLRAEFVFGSQKYAMLPDGRIAFRADGLYCVGVAENSSCGPHRFVIELLMRGSISQPASLSFEDWRVMPPPQAAAPTPF